jgi:hypothetical protein
VWVANRQYEGVRTGVELKSRNPGFGYVRIAERLSQVFGIALDKDVVRRVLAKHYRPGDSGSRGPSWLTLVAQTKDSLWRPDLCSSGTPRT